MLCIAGSYSIVCAGLESVLLHLLTWNALPHLALTNFFSNVSSCYIFTLLIQNLSTIDTRELSLFYPDLALTQLGIITIYFSDR